MPVPGSLRWIATLTRIAILTLVSAALLGGSILLIALLLSWLRGVPATNGANLYVGLVCGLIAWLFIAVFHLRAETLRLPLFAGQDDQVPFLEQVEAILGELGYERQGQSTAGKWFKPSFRSYLLGGRVRLAVEENQGIISGPKFCLELLRRRMRIRNHLDNVHQAIQERRRRHGERLVKRVQLGLRFTPELWPEVYQHVVKPLEREAEIVCDLNILAQSDAGIPESMLELQVRSWIITQGIPCEIRKDFLQRQEAGKPEAAIV